MIWTLVSARRAHAHGDGARSRPAGRRRRATRATRRPRLGRRGRAEARLPARRHLRTDGTSRRWPQRWHGRFRVLAPDLLGHGVSPCEPPWDIDAHVDALLETVGDEPATWLGHSFGARLAFELAAREPGLVERLVLARPGDPAAAARRALRRGERPARPLLRLVRGRRSSGASRRAASPRAEQCDARAELRSTSSRPTTAAGATATARQPSSPPTARWPPPAAVRRRHGADPAPARRATRTFPTTTCWMRTGRRPATARGRDRRRGHTVLWDAFDETAAAVARFLG